MTEDEVFAAACAALHLGCKTVQLHPASGEVRIEGDLVGRIKPLDDRGKSSQVIELAARMVDAWGHENLHMETGESPCLRYEKKA